jgi:hypothetical protein
MLLTKRSMPTRVYSQYAYCQHVSMLLTHAARQYVDTHAYCTSVCILSACQHVTDTCVMSACRHTRILHVSMSTVSMSACQHVTDTRVRILSACYWHIRPHTRCYACVRMTHTHTCVRILDAVYVTFIRDTYLLHAVVSKRGCVALKRGFIREGV